MHSDNRCLFLTCLVFETFEIQEEGANVTANALHPGTLNTGFGSNISVVLKGILFLSGRESLNFLMS